MDIQQFLPQIPDAELEGQLAGMIRPNRNNSPRHLARVAEAGRLWADALNGRLSPYYLQEALNPTDPGICSLLARKYPKVFLREAMTTSDFQALTADVLDRVLLGYYSGVPIPNLPVAKKTTLRDFRNRKLFFEDGMVTPMDKLGENEVHKQRALADNTPITYYPDVYAAGGKLSWRAMINDDLGIFTDIPQRLALAAQRTLHKFITGLYMDAAGPNVLLFKAAFANLITTTYGAASNNPALSATGLADAFTVLFKQVDSGGDPIMIPGKLFLFHGPALYTTVQNLMHLLSIDMTTLGGDKGAGATGTYTQSIKVNNWLIANIVPVLDPYMPIVCTASGVRATSWGLIADPASQQRPALEVGHLRGFETPQLFRKQPNTVTAGGGVDPMMGDFYTMATELKEIAAFGGIQVDGRSAVASNGSGS